MGSPPHRDGNLEDDPHSAATPQPATFLREGLELLAATLGAVYIALYDQQPLGRF
jgi:hypothetical protein